MTLACEADLARAVVEGRANPKKEQDFVATLNAMSSTDRYDMMEELECKLRKELNASIYDGFDVDILLAGENPWPGECP